MPLVSQECKDIDKFLYVVQVESGRRFIEDEECFAADTSLKEGNEFESLSLSPREFAERVPHTKMPEAKLGKRLCDAGNLRFFVEKFHTRFDRERENVVDTFPSVQDFEHDWLKPTPQALFARKIHITKKLHIFTNEASTTACSTSPCVHVK